MELGRLSISNKRDIVSILSHILLGLGLGFASVAVSPGLVLLSLAGLLGVALIFKRPEVGILTILIITSSIVYERQLPLIPIVVGSLHIPDFILLGLFALIAIRALVEPDFKLVKTPSDGLLLAFWGVTLLASLFAIGQGTLQFNIALRALRILTYYLIFFTVTNLIRSREQIASLLHGFFVIATGVALAMIVQYFLGDTLAIIPGRVETLATGTTYYEGIARIMPPGQSTIFVGMVTLAVVLSFDRVSEAALLRFIQVAVIALSLLLTFLRTFWLMVGLIFGLVLILTRAREQRRMAVWILLAAVVLCFVGILLFTSPGSPGQVLLNAFLIRMGTVTGTQFLEDSSFLWRFSEYDHAIPQILAHPVLGIGAGAQYRPYDPRMDWKQFDGRAYIHNGHLWIMLQAGLPGYALFMAWMLLTARRGIRAWGQVESVLLRGTLLSFSLLLLVLPIGAIVDPVYMQWFWTPVIGLMAGVIEVILCLNRQDQHTFEALDTA